MNKEFGDLVQQYEQALKDAEVQKQETLLSGMRQNIKERTNGVDRYSIDGESISIMNAAFEDLLKINGDITRKTTSDAMTEYGDSIRKTNLKENKYGPDNPYPLKD